MTPAMGDPAPPKRDYAGFCWDCGESLEPHNSDRIRCHNCESRRVTGAASLSEKFDAMVERVAELELRAYCRAPLILTPIKGFSSGTQPRVVSMTITTTKD